MNRCVHPNAPSCQGSAISVNPSRVEAAIGRLGRNKGVGKDGVPAELLQAGGSPLAIMVSAVYQKIVDSEKCPIAWTGGKIVDVYKRKGDAAECDASHGILLSDHISKGLCRILADHIFPAYKDNMPADQFGATSGRGTDMASHIVRTFIAHCTAAKLSMFVLFVDLVKAFDRVIREIVPVWPHDVQDLAAYLASLGLTPEQVDWTAAFVSRHGGLFEKWGVDRKVIALLRHLHSASWFS